MKNQIISEVYLKGSYGEIGQRTALFEIENNILNCKTTQINHEFIVGILPNKYSQYLKKENNKYIDNLLVLCKFIQEEVRDLTSFGKVVRISDKKINLAIPYQRKNIAKNSLLWAMKWLEVSGNELELQRKINLLDIYSKWLNSARDAGLSPNSMKFATAALNKGWPIEIDGSVVSIGWGKNNQNILSSFTNQTSYMAALLARNKVQTLQTLSKAGLPVPVSVCVGSFKVAAEVAKSMGWPVVIKPSNQDQGRGVVPGIVDIEELETAFNEAHKYSPGAVLVEKHIKGNDYRLLVVKGKMLMAHIEFQAMLKEMVLKLLKSC
jgi:cyanophycin synthetase